MYHYGTTNYSKTRLPDGSVNVTRRIGYNDKLEVIILIPFMLWMGVIFFTLIGWICEPLYNLTGFLWTVVPTITPYLLAVCWVIYPLYRLAKRLG